MLSLYLLNSPHVRHSEILVHANMPPKRGSTTRATGAARRGRSSARGRGQGSKEHNRVLSDIPEESVPQVKTTPSPEQNATQARGSKKRSFQDVATEKDAASVPAKRETRAQAAKRVRTESAAHESSPLSRALADALEQGTCKPFEEVLQKAQHREDPGVLPVDNAEPASDYIPSLNLLFFVQLGNLDTDSDTENMTLALIDLTLAEANWHTGLSGLVQPVACFLLASLLTRKQNLVEDVAASVEMLGLEYEQMVEGYKLLWEWRENMSGVVGEYAERLAELPDPALLLGQVRQEGSIQDQFQSMEGLDERPEPERGSEAIQV